MSDGLIQKLKTICLACCSLALVSSLTGCGGSSEGTDNADGGGNPPSNMARFTLNCDLQSVIGEMTLDVEVIQQSGIVWGPGPNPVITGVIGSGTYLYITAGELRSPVAYYIFTGENNFADFTDMITGDRFRVQWLEEANGVTMVVNPFGPAPGQHSCQVTGSQFL